VLTFSPTVKDAVPRNVKWSLDSATQLTGTVKLWDLVSVQGTYVASQKSGHLTVLTFKNRSTGRKGVVDGVQGDGSSLSVRTDKGEETWNLVQDTVVNGPVKRGKFAVGNQIFARVFPDNTLAEINVENVKAAPATTP